MSVRLRPELADRADELLDSDEQRKRHTELGDLFFEEFGYDRKGGNISSQVRGLQQMACSAVRFADVEDFVKNQMGKARSREKGEKQDPWLDVGEPTLAALTELRRQAAELARVAGGAVPPGEELQLRLKLARGWVRAVVGRYLYRKAVDQMENQHAGT
jgi:hypothetical protein